jgi:hypothetical protein
MLCQLIEGHAQCAALGVHTFCKGGWRRLRIVPKEIDHWFSPRRPGPGKDGTRIEVAREGLGPLRGAVRSSQAQRDWDDTWTSSARVPMPQYRSKDDDDS